MTLLPILLQVFSIFSPYLLLRLFFLTFRDTLIAISLGSRRTTCHFSSQKMTLFLVAHSGALNLLSMLTFYLNVKGSQ